MDIRWVSPTDTLPNVGISVDVKCEDLTVTSAYLDEDGKWIEEESGGIVEVACWWDASRALGMTIACPSGHPDLDVMVSLVSLTEHKNAVIDFRCRTCAFCFGHIFTRINPGSAWWIKLHEVKDQ